VTVAIAIGTALIASGLALAMEASGTGATAVLIALAIAVGVLAVLLAVVRADARRDRKRVPTVPVRMVEIGDDLPDWVSERRRARNARLDDTTVDGLSSELNEILRKDGRG
jgi:hypothetical protein